MLRSGKPRRNVLKRVSFLQWKGVSGEMLDEYRHIGDEKSVAPSKGA